jgi:hypothetical protein
MHDSKQIGLGGRWLLIAIGVVMSIGLFGAGLFAHVVGIAGVALVVSAIGLVELAMGFGIDGSARPLTEGVGGRRGVLGSSAFLDPLLILR